ncbi:MAG: helix-turn-helix domain-containing protein [Acidimicrobiia bacterium]
MEKPLFLTVPDVARALKVGRDKVYDAINAGELESVKIGSARRIPREALDAYIRRLRGQE